MEKYQSKISLQKLIADSTSPCQLRELLNGYKKIFCESSEMYGIFTDRINLLLNNEFAEQMISAYNNLYDDFEFECSPHDQTVRQNQIAYKSQLVYNKDIADIKDKINKEGRFIIKNDYISIDVSKLPKNTNIINEFKIEIYKVVLEHCKFNKTKASKLIGCSIRTIDHYIKKHNIYNYEEGK